MAHLMIDAVARVWWRQSGKADNVEAKRTKREPLVNRWAVCCLYCFFSPVSFPPLHPESSDNDPIVRSVDISGRAGKTRSNPVPAERLWSNGRAVWWCWLCLVKTVFHWNIMMSEWYFTSLLSSLCRFAALQKQTIQKFHWKTTRSPLRVRERKSPTLPSVFPAHWSLFMVALVRGKSKLLPPCATGQLGFRTVVLPRAMFIICLTGLLFFFC